MTDKCPTCGRVHDRTLTQLMALSPLKNLWLGVTAENQEQADARIPILLQTPAAVRFVSVEPMLGPVHLSSHRLGHCARCQYANEGDVCPDHCGDCRKIDWVICGGETGPGARPMQESWATNLLQQCQSAGVPFFMKKMSGGATPPSDLAIREFPNDK